MINLLQKETDVWTLFLIYQSTQDRAESVE